MAKRRPGSVKERRRRKEKRSKKEAPQEGRKEQEGQEEGEDLIVIHDVIKQGRPEWVQVEEGVERDGPPGPEHFGAAQADCCC